MTKVQMQSKLIIAGPGAGKTHDMVEKIILILPKVSPCRHIAVITYTNSATNNIRNRLSKRIAIPDNLFIGTIHSFLNRFIVIPFSALIPEPVVKEKLFMQCCIDDIFEHLEKSKSPNEKSKTPQQKAIIKAKLKKRLKERGYITFDQTLSIALECIDQEAICKTISNRLQYLFVDEFQDSCNQVYKIIESIRKKNKTNVYCVGDPEQYIQSFDSTIQNFSNIPIFKAAQSKGYSIEINKRNHRSTNTIVQFLNKFNGRIWGNESFSQIAVPKNGNVSSSKEPSVHFINKWENVKPMIDDFNLLSDESGIVVGNRCILAKKHDTINRINSALSQKYKNPKKTTSILPIKAIQDTLLTTLHLSLAEFCKKHNGTTYTVRKYAIAIYKAIREGIIKDENTYRIFITNVLKLEMKEGLPIKIENLKFDHHHIELNEVPTVANIHTIKGLEAEAVLTIAKTEKELLLWLEVDNAIRDAKRKGDDNDYPRLGYVAFSRAERLLCIGCLEKVQESTLSKLKELEVTIHDPLSMR